MCLMQLYVLVKDDRLFFLADLDSVWIALIITRSPSQAQLEPKFRKEAAAATDAKLPGGGRKKTPPPAPSKGRGKMAIKIPAIPHHIKMRRIAMHVREQKRIHRDKKIEWKVDHKVSTNLRSCVHRCLTRKRCEYQHRNLLQQPHSNPCDSC